MRVPIKYRALALMLAVSIPAGCDQGQLLAKIWEGVQEAQKKTLNACGKITETRTSTLLARPKIFRGEFCADGASKFSLEYKEPERVRLKFNGEFLNVSAGSGGLNTEAIRVGHHVRRTQKYFSRDNSIDNLKKEFVIEAREDGAVYELKLVPRSERFAGRINHVVVRLGKTDFTLRSLEVDGKSGVRSVFAIEITSKNTRLDDALFEVYKPAK